VDLSRHLRDAIAYDQWANEQWNRIADLPENPSLEAILAAMEARGVLRGQAEGEFPETDYIIWCNGHSTEPGSEGDEFLLARFDADLAAWTALYETHRHDEQFLKIFRHHAGCPHGWGEPMAHALDEGWPIAAPDEPMRMLDQSILCWKSLVLRYPLESEYRWQRPGRPDRAFTLEQIATHVTLHGAYHRGHLRGLGVIP
jgi:hypothetical protein